MSIASGFINPDVLTSMSPAEGEALYELAADKVCLEMGSWMGYSAICMAQTAKRVHCVDHFLGDMQAGFGTTLTQFFANLQRFGLFHKIVTHVGAFDDVLPALRGGYFGFVFCDGLHTREATEFQLEHARRVVEDDVDSVLAFHDYSDTEKYHKAGFRVKEVVDEWLDSDPDVKPYEFELVDTLAIVTYG